MVPPVSIVVPPANVSALVPVLMTSSGAEMVPASVNAVRSVSAKLLPAVNASSVPIAFATPANVAAPVIVPMLSSVAVFTTPVLASVMPPALAPSATSVVVGNSAPIPPKRAGDPQSARAQRDERRGHRAGNRQAAGVQNIDRSGVHQDAAQRGDRVAGAHQRQAAGDRPIAGERACIHHPRTGLGDTAGIRSQRHQSCRRQQARRSRPACRRSRAYPRSA